MNLKKISQKAVKHALELAERYRLLNEPEQAESICKDVLEIDSTNHLAIRTLLLAISDQFGRGHTTLQQAQAVALRLTDDYERHYYAGVIMERWARTKLLQNASHNLVHDWLGRAMDEFEKAESVRPKDDDSALLRWNTCMRLLEQLPARQEALHLADYGD